MGDGGDANFNFLRGLTSTKGAINARFIYYQNLTNLSSPNTKMRTLALSNIDYKT